MSSVVEFYYILSDKYTDAVGIKAPLRPIILQFE